MAPWTRKEKAPRLPREMWRERGGLPYALAETARAEANQIFKLLHALDGESAETVAKVKTMTTGIYSAVQALNQMDRALHDEHDICRWGFLAQGADADHLNRHSEEDMKLAFKHSEKLDPADADKVKAFAERRRQLDIEVITSISDLIAMRTTLEATIKAQQEQQTRLEQVGEADRLAAALGRADEISLDEHRQELQAEMQALSAGLSAGYGVPALEALTEPAAAIEAAAGGETEIDATSH